VSRGGCGFGTIRCRIIRIDWGILDKDEFDAAVNERSRAG